MDSADKYLTEKLSIENVPFVFSPHINPIYPPNNNLIFEEWMYRQYVGCNTDRVYLPVFWTSYLVNNSYAELPGDVPELQDYINSLDKTKKYWSIVQYDLGVVVDVSGIDLLLFNMSENKGVPIPLICQPHPYKFKGGKKWFASFVGGKTHELRESAKLLSGLSDYYISFDQHNIETYCRILHESMFTLCYRGFGLNSFRIMESIQFGSIPVYISDEHVFPYNIDFDEFGVVIKAEDAHRVDEILQAIEPEEIIKKQDRLQEIYDSYYTYEANYYRVINYLENEDQRDMR